MTFVVIAKVYKIDWHNIFVFACFFFLIIFAPVPYYRDIFLLNLLRFRR